MKKIIKTSIVSCCLLIGTLGLSGQTKKVYPNPEFPDKLYSYDETKNEAADMQPGILTEDSRAASFSADESFFYIEGEKSTLRIKKGAKSFFLLKWYNDYLDPNATYVLMKLKYNPKKKRREVVLSQSSTFVNSSKDANVKIYYKTKKVQEVTEDNNIYAIRLFTIENLEPGEYVWKMDRKNDALFFGVDE